MLVKGATGIIIVWGQTKPKCENSLLKCMGKCEKEQWEQVSFKKEVAVRVNDLIVWLTVWLILENLLLTFKWYMFMWHVNKVCEWPLLQQMKVCFNAWKMSWKCRAKVEWKHIRLLLQAVQVRFNVRFSIRDVYIFYTRSYALLVGNNCTATCRNRQLMPWLHRTPGHAVAILLIMKIDSEETPL